MWRLFEGGVYFRVASIRLMDDIRVAFILGWRLYQEIRYSLWNVLYFNTRPTSVFQITHNNLYIPHIPATTCTIAMVFLDCILTSGLNL